MDLKWTNPSVNGYWTINWLDYCTCIVAISCFVCWVAEEQLPLNSFPLDKYPTLLYVWVEYQWLSYSIHIPHRPFTTRAPLLPSRCCASGKAPDVFSDYCPHQTLHYNYLLQWWSRVYTYQTFGRYLSTQHVPKRALSRRRCSRADGLQCINVSCTNHTLLLPQRWPAMGAAEVGECGSRDASGTYNFDDHFHQT